eukprot:TRINITY_DN12305_c0_g1::TRINITY_DN12305_c0_g1_i1::g.13002::m.13002 TRINITY_DN12305_c0_g1::TRINITY_DN12305_c0_g1_i1::g.13002  ORF type:complete len:113 (-),score=-15.26,DUF1700/PF08006.6/0.21 TRINITY_DN12305_c0_g1_i1:407-745(-)
MLIFSCAKMPTSFSFLSSVCIFFAIFCCCFTLHCWSFSSSTLRHPFILFISNVFNASFCTYITETFLISQTHITVECDLKFWFLSNPGPGGTRKLQYKLFCHWVEFLKTARI